MANMANIIAAIWSLILLSVGVYIFFARPVGSDDEEEVVITDSGRDEEVDIISPQ